MGCFSFIFGKRELPWQQSDLGVEAPGIETLKVYSYKELSNATKDFCLANKVGEGGFGSVFKGKLKNGIDVAIKVLSTESKQGAREFLTELSVVSNAVHDNLVKMYGCCVEGTHRMLVYNYLENNSLAKTLLGQNPNNIKFNWRTRANICIGVARGLAYLHEEAQTHIIHRDIKASNVLLDKDLNPKISDFGLAKLLPPSTTHVSTRVAGTIGYLAPEYAIRGQVTRKSDVYSFGVLLLEIVSDRSNTNLRLPYDEQFLLERAWTLYERGKLSEIIDTSLSDDLDIEEARRFLKIVFLCTQDNPKLRPSMSAIVMMLTGKREVKMEKISKPALISDFMDLKVRSHDDVNTASTESSLMENSASMTFTTVCERD